MSVGKSSYFLVHCETGQRYPIRSGVIIGRGSADIVFSKDTKLSNQHCEVTPAEEGLLVRDLHSANGTYLNGKKIQPDKPYLLKDGGEIAAGEQSFQMKTVSLTKNLKRRRRKRKRRSGGFGESYAQVFLVLLAALGIFMMWRKGGAGFSISGEVAMSQSQLAEIFENYLELRLSLDRETAPPAEISRRMQGEVLGRLSTVSRRWGEFQPVESERMQFAAENTLAKALAGHAKSQILYINTAETKYLDELDSWTEQLEQAVNDMRSLPGGQSFPGFVQSPLQLVEREMRQALREYRKLGLSVEKQEITQKEMGARIRTVLMPKLKAVYAKMGAIAPQNDFEKRKVLLEQKLMTGFLGQIKALSLSVDSGDAKYAAEVVHWTKEIEKINVDLKNTLGYGRAPAAAASKNE